MRNIIERYGRKHDKESFLKEMPILGQRHINQPLSHFFVQHMSDQIQVTYVIEGNIDFTLDGCVHQVKKGDIIINKPGQVFGALNETFPQSKSAFFKINLGTEHLGWDKDELYFFNRSMNEIIFPHLTPGKEFYSIFTRIIQEHRQETVFSKTKSRALFQELLILILEAHNEFIESVNYKVNSNGDMLTLVNKFVGENLHRKIYTKEMADAADLSESYFRYLFSTLYKTSPADYILRRRIEKAKELLLGTKPITDISYELAFSSSQYFSNSFKKLTGMRPKQYRKALHSLSEEGKQIFSDQESSEFMDSFYI